MVLRECSKYINLCPGASWVDSCDQKKIHYPGVLSEALLENKLTTPIWLVYMSLQLN